jgi:hypothetical protein
MQGNIFAHVSEESIRISDIFYCYNKIPEAECFIKKRGFFSSQFGRLEI